MPSNPPVHEDKPRPVVLGMHFDALTVPQALDRFFELAAMPPGPRGCRIAATHACRALHASQMDTATKRGGIPEWQLQLNKGNTDLES